MIFEFFGITAFDLSAPFSFIEILIAAIVIIGISFLIFLVLFFKAKKYHNAKIDSDFSKKKEK